MSGRVEIRRTMDFHLITSLLRGEAVVLCGSDNEPSVFLTFEKEERPRDLDDALDQISRWWED